MAWTTIRITDDLKKQILEDGEGANYDEKIRSLIDRDIEKMREVVRDEVRAEALR